MIGDRTPFFHATQAFITFCISENRKMLEAQMRVSNRLDRGLIKEVKVARKGE